MVRNLKFSAVYEKYLKGKDKNICLKVMDQLIKGEDSMMKLAKLFGNAALGVVRLVGRVVGEKPVFYKYIDSISNKGAAFSLDELEYPKME